MMQLGDRELNGTTTTNVKHIYRSGFFVKEGEWLEDICLKVLGQETNECKLHNSRGANKK